MKKVLSIIAFVSGIVSLVSMAALGFVFFLDIVRQLPIWKNKTLAAVKKLLMPSRNDEINPLQDL